MGLYFNTFRKSFDLKNNAWIKELWDYSRNESTEFHKRLNKGQFIAPITLMTPRKTDEFFYHFANSNIGVMKSSETKSQLIRIKQSFTTARYNKENNFCWFTNLLATINNQLCWTISFNSHFVSQQLTTCIISNISKIIKEIIK